jgi:chromosome segregation ATPase
MKDLSHQEPKPPRFKLLSLLKDGTWFASLTVLLIFAINVVDERSQLRSDVKHLTDTLAEVRKDLESAHLENKQLNDSLRQSQIDLATNEVRLEEFDKQLASVNRDALNSKAEAETYKALTASDKRCEPYRQDISRLERKLAISALDVFSARGEQRKEALAALERSKDSLDACMGIKR